MGKPTRARAQVEVQQRVVRAVWANLQMYRATRAQQRLQAEVDRRAGWLLALQQEAAGAGAGAGGPAQEGGKAVVGAGEELGDGGMKASRRGTRSGVAARAKRSATAAGLSPGAGGAGPGGGGKSQRVTRSGAAGGRRGKGAEEGGGGGGGGGGKGGGPQDRRAILRSMMAHFQGS